MYTIYGKKEIAVANYILDSKVGAESMIVKGYLNNIFKLKSSISVKNPGEYLILKILINTSATQYNFINHRKEPLYL